jgi:hypothetical protein
VNNLEERLALDVDTWPKIGATRLVALTLRRITTSARGT